MILWSAVENILAEIVDDNISPQMNDGKVC